MRLHWPRQSSPPDPRETRRIERWLATARLGLVVATLVAILIDPTEIAHSWAANGLYAFYIANGILILMLLLRRKQSTSAFRFAVHCVDIVWPALISIFAEPRMTFFPFFFFALAAAAYRWGLWETLGTAIAETAVLWVQSFVVLHFLPSGSAFTRIERSTKSSAGGSGSRHQAR